MREEQGCDRVDGTNPAKRRGLLTLACAALLQGALAAEELRLPHIFTDHMVLQCDLPIAVWGWGEPGAQVDVVLDQPSGWVEAPAVVDADGRWSVRLPPVEASSEPHQLSVKSGDEQWRAEQIAIGEVWLCAGQSNMNRGTRVEPFDPDVRLFWIDGSTVPRQHDLGNQIAGWVPATEAGLASATPPLEGRNAGKPRREFAEVGWVFGQKIREELEVPVGLIKCAFGGSQVEAWTPVPDIATTHPFDVKVERSYVGHTPGLMYQAMVHGIVPITCRGVLWYQGENNGRHKDYLASQRRWIDAWRGLWNRPDLPFYLVQIAPTSYAGGRMQFIWEAQSQLCREVEGVELAASNDIYLHGRNADRLGELLALNDAGQRVLGGPARPSNPHPPNKHVVAERLAAIALVETYGKPERPRFAPRYASHAVKDGRVTVHFERVDGELRRRDSEPLCWFEVAPAKREGERRHGYVPAQARITSANTVEVWAEAVPDPAHVRFAWNCIAVHRLVDGADLPAIAFLTDRDDG